MSQSEALDILRRTHQIYCGIKGKDITLIPANPPGSTDCESFITLPIEDPEADIIHKHEWSHIFFKSNLRARTVFVDAYVEQLMARVGASTVGPWRSDISGFIHVLVNALDDLRVNSLWGLIYPNSSERVARRWSNLLVNSMRYRRDIVMLLMTIGVGLERESLQDSEWDRYRPLLADAVLQVTGRGFVSCLMAARLVLDSILNDVVLASLTNDRPPAQALFIDPPQKLGSPRTSWKGERDEKESRLQSGALERLAHQASRPTRWDIQQGDRASFMDTERLPLTPDPDYRATQAMARTAMGVSTADQVSYVLEQSKVDMEDVLEALRGMGPRLSADQRLMQGFENVSFVDIKPYMVADLPLSLSDKRMVSVLRQSFVKLMDKKSRVRSESGSEFDMDSYIDMVFGNGDADIFREESSSRGFSSLILIDMSSSMQAKWDYVSRACKVLAKAMRFPFSTFEVWGFSSNIEGKVSILRFEDTEREYWGAGLKDIWGLTPLHVAVSIGVRRMLFMPGTAQHMFVLTDGCPTHFGLSNNSMPTTAELIAGVTRGVQQGRQKGVNISGLVAGWDVPEAAATAMFGRARWRRVGDEDELFQGLVELVRASFTSYLRHR